MRVFALAAGLTLFSMVVGVGATQLTALQSEQNNRETRHFAALLAGLSELPLQGRAVNSPGNDVFVSHDTERERSLMARESGVFDTLVEALRGQVRDEVRIDTAPILSALDDVSAAKARMVALGQQVFDLYKAGQTVAATERMAYMDDVLDQLNGAVMDAHDAARTEQLRLLAEKRSPTLSSARRLTVAVSLRRFGGVLIFLAARKAAAHDRTLVFEETRSALAGGVAGGDGGAKPAP